MSEVAVTEALGEWLSPSGRETANWLACAAAGTSRCAGLREASD